MIIELVFFRGMAHQYQQELTVYITGGDSVFISKQLSSTCIQQDNLVLQGLYKIKKK